MTTPVLTFCKCGSIFNSIQWATGTQKERAYFLYCFKCRWSLVARRVDVADTRQGVAAAYIYIYIYMRCMRTGSGAHTSTAPLHRSVSTARVGLDLDLEEFLQDPTPSKLNYCFFL